MLTDEQVRNHRQFVRAMARFELECAPAPRAGER